MPSSLERPIRWPVSPSRRAHSRCHRPNGHLRAALNTSIPAFLISGDTGVEPLRAARVARYHLLRKPVRPMALRNMLHRYLRGHDVADAFTRRELADFIG